MKYQDWLNQYIEWDYTLRVRKHSIADFVNNGLLPFMNKHGYSFNVSGNFIQSVIATGLYENRGFPHVESKWDYQNPSGNTEWNTEYLQHYDGFNPIGVCPPYPYPGRRRFDPGHYGLVSSI